MYSTLILLFFFSGTFPLNASAYPNPSPNLVVFGDSYSDIGNVYRLTGHTYPIVPPYYKGEFCDGPNWVEILTKSLIVADYAYGGATTDNNLVQDPNLVQIPGVLQQVTTYLNSLVGNTHSSEHPVYVIWAGGNDLIYNSSLTAAQIVNSLMDSVKALAAVHGAKDIIVFNSAPIEDTPYIRINYNLALYGTYFTQFTSSANSDLFNSLQALKANCKDTSFHIFDLFTLISKIISHPQPPFTNVVDNCWNAYNLTTVIQYCSNPKQYLFLDTLHFSSTVHKMIANEILPFFSNNFVKNSPGSCIHSF
jgi:outer membrane lipase/esterase